MHGLTPVSHTACLCQKQVPRLCSSSTPHAASATCRAFHYRSPSQHRDSKLRGHSSLSWEGQGVMSVDTGAAFIAGACVAWGIDNNLTRKLSSSDPMQIAMAKGLSAGVVNIAIALMRGAVLPAVGTTGAAAVVGFLGVGVSLLLFGLALRHLRNGCRAYFSLAPFIKGRWSPSDYFTSRYTDAYACWL